MSKSNGNHILCLFGETMSSIIDKNRCKHLLGLPSPKVPKMVENGSKETNMLNKKAKNLRLCKKSGLNIFFNDFLSNSRISWFAYQCSQRYCSNSLWSTCSIHSGRPTKAHSNTACWRTASPNCTCPAGSPFK